MSTTKGEVGLSSDAMPEGSAQFSSGLHRIDAMVTSNTQATGAASAGAEGAADPHDSGLLCLAFVAGHYQVRADLFQMIHDAGPKEGVCDSDDLMRIASRLGFKSRLQRHQEAERLAHIPLPALLRLETGQFVVAALRLSDGRLRVFDPQQKAILDLAAGESPALWSGDIVLIAPKSGLFQSGVRSFDLGWFLRALYKYRWPLGHVLLASLFVQLFALATPLLFQVVIDKVLVHKGMSTLIVIVIGLIGLSLFEVILNYLRNYALTHTTSRIDVELGAQLFDHLLRLPVSYHDTRAAGQTVARVRELETIRAFLTGQGLSSLIDIAFALIFISVLFLYSPVLTWIVLASIPAYLIVTFAIRPLLRDRIDERFKTGAASQQLLVETIIGFQTVKSGAVEPAVRMQWEQRLADYVRSSFDAVNLSSIGQNAFQLISKVTTALVLFVGAKAVIEGELTVGGLIAFNMIMGQVTAPILRLSQLWQDLQQVLMSVDRVGDILRSPTEGERFESMSLPQIKGDIALKGVSFRYHPEGADILKDIALDIPAGQVIGIVGPSGSGKSTLTKLLQRLYRPTRGQILVDGIDISYADAASLRRQIGVVLQENILFNRSIHDNIALANPAMPRTHVIALAKLAGADEFIVQLPRGYDTIVEERGSNLSGGQRQRLAIARALAMNPRILIFDEATSALDYESERQIQNNMRLICQGRTVIIIAHRLAAVRHCDRIITIDKGQIVEDGSHASLIAKQGGFYSNLWEAQAIA